MRISEGGRPELFSLIAMDAAFAEIYVQQRAISLSRKLMDQICSIRAPAAGSVVGKLVCRRAANASKKLQRTPSIPASAHLTRFIVVCVRI